MHRTLFIFSLVSILSTSCRKDETSALSARSQRSLEGCYVRIALNRSALGVATHKPLSRQTSTYDGVEVSVSGYVVAEMEQFIVLSEVPVDGHELDRDFHWFPLTSILSIRQLGKAESKEPQAVDPLVTWRFESLQNLLGMVAFPLKELPQGELELWFEKDGKKDYLDGVDTTPGFDRWLQIGIDPVNQTSVIVSVVSEEDRGSSRITLPTGPLTPLRKTIKPGHNWRESSIIAKEGSGDGKVYARLKPKD
jgi:hypothetical protein